MLSLNTPTYVRLRNQLRSDIVAGIWPLGSQVTLAELAKHYQVSANPVREALLQLQGEGVIVMRMNRGAVIPQVDAQFIDNLYRIRGAIQMMLIRDVAMKATEDDVARLRNLVDAFGQASQQNDTAACVAANRELHHAIDALAANPMALEMLEGRSSLVDAYRSSIGYGEGRSERAHAQHVELVEAIAARDSERAACISFAHTEAARIDLADMARKRQPKPR